MPKSNTSCSMGGGSHILTTCLHTHRVCRLLQQGVQVAPHLLLSTQGRGVQLSSRPLPIS